MIDFCIQTGRLYDSAPYHNVVFVGMDAGDKPRYANLRGMRSDFKGEASGSDKHFSFSIPAKSEKKLVIKYNKTHKDDPLFKVTPHTFRHTFCTKMANAGMNPKALQYIMGHSNITMTLNYYAHADFTSAKAEMERLEGRLTATHLDEQIGEDAA